MIARNPEKLNAFKRLLQVAGDFHRLRMADGAAFAHQRAPLRYLKRNYLRLAQDCIKIQPVYINSQCKTLTFGQP